MSPSQLPAEIFITGGAGFIGANLVAYLLEHGLNNLTIYDDLSTGSSENLQRAVADSGIEGNVRLIRADILDFDRLCREIKERVFVIHLAAHTQVRQSIIEPAPHLRINSQGTMNVIEAARVKAASGFVFASSNAAVGEQVPPVNESMVPRPLSPYGAVKLYGEALCSAYFRSFGLRTVALRFANAYGPYSLHKTSVIAKFLKLVSEGENLEIYGDGRQTRDFIHAQDIAQAIFKIITYDRNEGTGPWGQVFQIATGRETRIIDLAREIYRLAGRDEEELLFGDEMEGEIRQNFSDIGKARKVLGFEPTRQLQTELAGLCDQLFQIG